MCASATLRRHSPAPGLFVTFEGGEGAGKSTLVERLSRRLLACGREVVATREPGGSVRAESIRAALLAGRAKVYGALAETVLFAAARADHVERLVWPALARGAVVLCDRFTDSSRVYQGVLGGVPAHIIETLERVVVSGVRPQLTLVLDLPAEVGLARAARRVGGPDRFEGEGLAYHERIREAFTSIAGAEPERCAVVDARGTPDEVEARAWTVLQPHLVLTEATRAG